jgi:hypothetical protein
MKNEEANLAIIALRLPVKRYIFLFNFTGNKTGAHVVISNKRETHTTTHAAAGGTQWWDSSSTRCCYAGARHGNHKRHHGRHTTNILPALVAIGCTQPFSSAI